MAKPPAPLPPADRQQAEFLIVFGEHARLRLGLDVSSAGLLSIAALVSGILLSSAVIVRVATQGRRSIPWPTSGRDPRRQ